MTRSWYERRQRAETLAESLREILNEADDLAGLARAINSSVLDRRALDSRAVAAMLKVSAYGLRSAVAELLDELRDDLEPAAFGFDHDQVARGRPVSLERVAELLAMFDEPS